MRYFLSALALLLFLIDLKPCSALSPGIVGGKREYTLVFVEGGETSRGDIAGDDRASISGKSGAVVATGDDGIKLLQGSVILATNSQPVKILLEGLDSIAAADAHSRILISRRESGYLLDHLEGGSAITLRDRAAEKFSAGSMVEVKPDQSTVALLNAPGSRESVWEPIKKEPIRMIASNGTQFLIKDNTFRIKKGTAFMQLPGTVSLITPAGTIRSSKPYIISYRLSGGNLCLENCTPTDSVDLEVRGEHLKLEPFHCCMFRHCDGASAEVPDDGVLRRNVVAKSDGVFTVMLSEFDPQSLLDSHKALNQTLKHPISTKEEKIGELLFKGVAVFQELCGDLDSFVNNPKVEVVGMLGHFKNPVKFTGYNLEDKLLQWSPADLSGVLRYKKGEKRLKETNMKKKMSNASRTSSGPKNAERAQARADSKNSRVRTKELGTADGTVDRSSKSKEAALASVKEHPSGQ